MSFIQDFKQHNHTLLYDAKGRLNFGTEFGNKYLTKREVEIIRLLLQGHSAKGIASALKISHRTVESYINTLKLKFECQRKSELIAFFMNLLVLSRRG